MANRWIPLVFLLAGCLDEGALPESEDEERAGAAPYDVTFYVVSDTHADPPKESYDLRATARAINAVAGNGTWPATINGQATGFLGGPIAPPRGVVFLGDITGWGTAPSEIASFQHHFQAGVSDKSIKFPSYVGLGNHDLDSADRPADLAAAYRAQFWAYVDGRHKGAGAPVPVSAFDAASHAYSWDWNGVHLVQTHRLPGDKNYGLPSSLPFVANDLSARAGDGRPVFLFHHYGMDAFGTQDRWWTAADRNAYRDVLAPYRVAAIFVGHSHAAMQYTWEGQRVFHVNNAKAEIGTGNNDGKGSFAIVRITNDRLNVVTARWTDDQGHYELIAPYYNGPALLPAKSSYRLVAKHSGKCLDVAAAGTADGTNIQQWTCNGTGAQSFRTEDLGGGYVRLRGASGKCVDVAGAGTGDGVNVQLWTCNGTAAQAFKLEDKGGGYKRLRNQNSQKCVDVDGARGDDGANVLQWSCHEGPNQQWLLQAL